MIQKPIAWVLPADALWPTTGDEHGHPVAIIREGEMVAQARIPTEYPNVEHIRDATLIEMW